MEIRHDTPVVSPVLIGRAPQVAALHRLIETTTSGDGQVALISGEAGIGKSRLALEASSYAITHGVLVLRGQCFPPDLDSPYAPFRDLLRTEFVQRPVPSQTIENDAATRDLLQLLPGIVPLPPEQAAAPLLEPEARKQRLFAALTHYILRRVAHQPILLVIEDLHWSDEASLELLAHLARFSTGQPLLLLLTYRSDEVSSHLRRLLVSLDRERHAQEFALPRLARDDVAAMLRAIFSHDRPVRAEFLDAIYPLTEGNPFFVEELLKSLIAAGDIFYSAGGWDRKPLHELRIPRNVQDAVQQRAEHLSAPARRLLAIAAVAGRQFDIVLLRHLVPLEEAALVVVLKELIAAQLVVEETADRFAFRHALTRETVYAELLVRERKTLHRSLAEAIERLFAETRDAYLAELAYHYEAAEVWDKVLPYAQQAAEQARLLYSPHMEIDQLTRALRAAQELGAPLPLALYRARGQAYATLGTHDCAQADYEACLERAQAANDYGAEWQAMLDLGRLWTARDYHRAGNYYQQALVVARNIDDPAVLAQSLNRVGNWLVNVEQPRNGLQLHEEALAMFERIGDQHGMAETFDLLGMAYSQTDDTRRAAASYEHAITLFRALGDRHGLTSALTTVAFLGGNYFNDTLVPAAPDVADCEAAGAEALQIARDTDWRAGESYALFVLSGRAGVQGSYASALELAQASLITAESIGHRQWMAAAHLTQGALYRDLLALEEARDHCERGLALAQAAGSTFWVSNATALFAGVCIEQGDLASGATALDARALTLPALSFAHRQCWCAQAELALASGDPSAALHIVDELGATAANRLDEQDIPRLAKVRGDALAALGQIADAEQALQGAQQGAQRLGLRPLMWRTLVSLGVLYQKQQRQTDALQAWTRAEAIIQELAADVPGDAFRTTFTARALGHIPEASLKRLTAQQERAGLTAREREVACLIAQGHSNRAIAATLVLSVRTVEDHVSRILAKLRFRSRAQVAAWAVDTGLISHAE